MYHGCCTSYGLVRDLSHVLDYILFIPAAIPAEMKPKAARIAGVDAMTTTNAMIVAAGHGCSSIHPPIARAMPMKPSAFNLRIASTVALRLHHQQLQSFD
jgi:hypothetical protein